MVSHPKLHMQYEYWIKPILWESTYTFSQLHVQSVLQAQTQKEFDLAQALIGFHSFNSILQRSSHPYMKRAIRPIQWSLCRLKHVVHKGARKTAECWYPLGTANWACIDWEAFFHHGNAESKKRLSPLSHFLALRLLDFLGLFWRPFPY